MNAKTILCVLFVLTRIDMTFAELFYSSDKIVSIDYLSNDAKKYFKEHNAKMTEELMWIPYHDVTIPDSLAGSFFKFGTSNFVASLSGSTITYDTITGYCIRNSEGEGDRYYFDLKADTTRKPHFKNAPFYFISKSIDDIQSIQSQGLFGITAQNDKLEIKKKIVEYFEANQSEFTSLKSYLNLNKEQNVIPEAIVDSFIIDFKTMHFDNANNGLIIMSAKYKYNDFVVLYLADNNSIHYLECSKFLSVITIHNDIYLLVSSYKAGTGWRGYDLYKIGNGKLERVFSDYTYST